MKKDAKIAVVCLARETFDTDAALRLYQNTITDLKQIPAVTWVFMEELIITPQAADATGEALKRENPDAVIIISGTFHLGHLALTIDKYLQQPILLWAFPELPYDGGKIRLNAVCGVNLNASNLYKAGRDAYHCIVSDTIDMAWLHAVQMRATLRHAHVGIAGYRADGFFNLSVADTALFQQTGVLIDHYELNVLTKQANPRHDMLRIQDIKETFDCSCLQDSQIEKTAQLANSMEQFLQENQLDALAVRCWPEFANFYGISPCAAMSLLADRGHTIGCEGDVEGTLSLLACNALTDSPAFLADLSQLDFQKDTALLWHCGVAAPKLWDQKSKKTLDTYFAGGRGVTAGFVMQSGPVTMMRIDSAREKTRLFLATGDAIPMEKALSGTYCRVRFSQPVSTLFETITQTGVAHHVALLYGDHRNAMRHFAKMMGFAIIQ